MGRCVRQRERRSELDAEERRVEWARRVQPGTGFGRNGAGWNGAWAISAAGRDLDSCGECYGQRTYTWESCGGNEACCFETSCAWRREAKWGGDQGGAWEAVRRGGGRHRSLW